MTVVEMCCLIVPVAVCHCVQLSVSPFEGGKQFHVFRVLTADEVECVYFTESDVTAGKLLVAEQDNNEETPQKARDKNILKAEDDRAIISCRLISRWTDDYLAKVSNVITISCHNNWYQ